MALMSPQQKYVLTFFSNVVSPLIILAAFSLAFSITAKRTQKQIKTNCAQDLIFLRFFVRKNEIWLDFCAQKLKISFFCQTSFGAAKLLLLLLNVLNLVESCETGHFDRIVLKFTLYVFTTMYICVDDLFLDNLFVMIVSIDYFLLG